MKIALAILVILPLVAQAYPAEKRQLNPFLTSILHLVHFDDFRLIVEGILKTAGSVESEAACELACPIEVHKYATGTVDTLVSAACPVMCTSMKELAHLVDAKIPHLGSTAATL